MSNCEPPCADPPSPVVDTPDNFTDSPALQDVDELCDNDLEHLPYEKRVQLALTAIRAGVMSERGACKYYRVTRETVQNRAKGVPTHTEAHAHERKLSEAKESILKEWVKVMGARGIPLSLPTIADYASELAGEDVDINWAKRFKERHPDLKRYDIKSKNIYNMDEKGIQLGVGDKIRVLVDRDQKAIQKIDSSNRDLVTIIECICSDGTALHPSVVYEGQRRDLRWGENNPCDASISISPNGWTDQQLGRLWLEKDFAPETAALLDDPGDYRLVILDGHNSHCSWPFINFAQKHRIIILCLPSHTTHALQPCDVGVFGPLAKKWKALVSQGVTVDKYNLLFHYSTARNEAFKPSTIVAEFRRCGICLLDEDAIPEELFKPSENYTTQAAQPLPPRLPSLLVPIATASSLSTPVAAPSSASNTTASHISNCHQYSFIYTPPRPNETAQELLQACYTIALPSPLCGTASRQAIRAENEDLHRIAKAAGVELEKSYAQTVLMNKENGRLRQQPHAKKNKQKRTYTTTQARHIREANAEKAAKRVKREVERAVAKAAREAEKAATKAAKAADRGGSKGGKGCPKRGSEGSEGRRQSSTGGGDVGVDVDALEEGPEGRGKDTRGTTRTVPSAGPSPRNTPSPSPSSSLNSSRSSSPTANAVAEEDPDDDNDEGETGIDSINGHHWAARRNLEFQVVWMDGDVTWEPLSSVNDCAAMDDYLTHRDVDDPLCLPKRKYLINTSLKATNEYACVKKREERQRVAGTGV
ncbi:DDE-domain-containing protein [Mycena venus]|uniref:DDE-domain-containing protein n=1 Tax=Mycena venus TaxID=2733690 RepID=A0A8H6XMA2_9AGAR|nr:DDE-domain-containing protein [Mycena venus]